MPRSLAQTSGLQRALGAGGIPPARTLPRGITPGRVCGADMAAEQQRFDIVLPITFPAALDVRGLSGCNGTSEDPARCGPISTPAATYGIARVRVPEERLHIPTLLALGCCGLLASRLP